MKNEEKATFAGGCFWCMESPFIGLQGVLSVTVGYTGGGTKNPTYEEVCKGASGHFEAVQIVFDPTQIKYEALLEAFWYSIDPVDAGGQFCDRGSQYRTAIFYHNDMQRRLAEHAKERVPHQPVATLLLPAGVFYPAEEYHQKYQTKNPLHYKVYRVESGREARLSRLWKRNS